MTASKVTCTVCGRRIGRMGIGQHANKHRREFEAVFGRPPRSYDEVRRAYDQNAGEWVGAEGAQTQLVEFGP